VRAAASHPEVGAALAADIPFVRTLADRISSRRLARVLSQLYFCAHPPPAHIVEMVVALPPDDRPAWTRIGPAGDAGRVLVGLGRLIRERPWAGLVDEHELPDTLLTGPWPPAILRTVRASSLPEAERLLRFADGQVERVAPASVTEAVKAAVKVMVAFGEGCPADRIVVAARLRRRVGEVFGVIDPLRWAGLEPELARVRMWVAGEILDLVFKRIVPDDRDLRAQARARHEFWRRYTRSVDRLWLLVHEDLADRLDDPEIQRLMRELPGVIETAKLKGGPEQAVVWMHLRTTAGTLVTAVEGNANTMFRMARGAIAPTRSRPVQYSPHIVNARSWEHELRHQGQWEPRFAEALSRAGVRP
jgi:hypothetical protein